MAKKRSRQATKIRELEEKIRSLQAGAAAPAAGVASGARAQAGSLLTRAGAAVSGGAPGDVRTAGLTRAPIPQRSMRDILQDVDRGARETLDPAGRKRLGTNVRRAIASIEPGVEAGELAQSRVSGRVGNKIGKLLIDAKKQGVSPKGLRALLAAAAGAATGKFSVPKKLPAFLKKKFKVGSLKPSGLRTATSFLSRPGLLPQLAGGAAGLFAFNKLSSIGGNLAKSEGSEAAAIQDVLAQARSSIQSPSQILQDLATDGTLSQRALRLQAQDPGAFQRLASAGGSSNAVSLPRGAVAFSPSGGGGAAASDEEIVQQLLEQLG